MRSKEEYLVKYEEALLGKLSSTFNSLNRDIIVCFSLLLVFLLFQNQLIEEATIAGNKLKLSIDQSFIFLPVLICIVYLLINNSILRIAKIVSLLKYNSFEIKALNNDARPFIVEDLNYLTEGIAGVQLQLSKFIVKRFLNKDLINLEVAVPDQKNFKSILIFTISLPVKIIRSANELLKKFWTTFLWLLLLVLVFIIPLGVPAVMLYHSKIQIIIENFKFPDSLLNYYLWVFSLLIIIILYTLISNLILYSFYFSELVELKENLVAKGYSKITLAILKIGKYYKRQ